MTRTVIRHRAASLLLASGLPLGLWLLNPDWIFTNPFNPPWFDPFVYQSLFMFPSEAIKAHPDYYPATRIPLIASAHTVYSFLSPLAANFVLKIGWSALTLLFVFTTARRIAGLAAATATVLLMGSYPYYVMSAGWDYTEGLVGMLLALCYAAATIGAAQARGWRAPEFVIGAGFATLLALNLTTAAFGPSIALFYVAVLARNGHLSFRVIGGAAAAATLGALAGIAGWSILNAAFGGNPMVLAVQINAALQLSKTSRGEGWSIFYKDWAYLQPLAIWLAFVIATALAALGAGTVALVRVARRRYDLDDVFMTLLALHYLLVVGLFVLSTAISMAVLMVWFYTDYLLVSGFVTLACVLGYVSREQSRVRNWLWLVAGLLFLVHAPALGLPVQRWFGFNYGAVTLATATAWVIAGVGLVVVAWKPRFALLTVPGLVALAVGWASMITQPQLNFVQQAGRAAGFEAIVDASREVESVSGQPRRYVWIDRNEQPFGGLFGAVFIRSIPLSRDWSVGFDATGEFPQLPQHGFKAGDPVVILTGRHDWRQAADQKLASIGLMLGNPQQRTIRHGPVEFEAILATLEPGGAS